MPFGLSRPARWLLTAAMLASVCSCGKRGGNEADTADAPIAINVYTPQDGGAEAWGPFDFYKTHATLSAFQGHLSLESVGRLPAAAGEEFAGAQVFRITNAQEFHDGNANRDFRCLAPALWLAVKPTDGKLRIALLTLEKWQEFEPKKPGLCGGGLYQAQ